MFGTPLTVVGYIVNDLQRCKVGDQEVVKCRVVSSSRRRIGDRGGSRLYQRVRDRHGLSFVVGDAGNSSGRPGFVAGDCTHREAWIKTGPDVDSIPTAADAVTRAPDGNPASRSGWSPLLGSTHYPCHRCWFRSRIAAVARCLGWALVTLQTRKAIRGHG